jgi:hypothetical protein
LMNLEGILNTKHYNRAMKKYTEEACAKVVASTTSRHLKLNDLLKNHFSLMNVQEIHNVAINENSKRDVKPENGN